MNDPTRKVSPRNDGLSVRIRRNLRIARAKCAASGLLLERFHKVDEGEWDIVWVADDMRGLGWCVVIYDCRNYQPGLKDGFQIIIRDRDAK